MAEIKIQRKSISWWPILIGVIVLSIAIILFATRTNEPEGTPYGGGPDAPERGPLLHDTPAPRANQPGEGTTNN